MRTLNPWLVLATAFVVIATFVGFDLQAERARVTESSREQVAQLASVVASDIVHELQTVNRVLEAARDHPSPLASAKDAAGERDAVLRTLADAIVGLDSLVMVDRVGTVVASSDAALVGRDFRLDPRLGTLRLDGNAGTLHVSLPYTNAAGRYSMSLARLRLDREGRRDGVVLAEIDPRHYEVVLRSVSHFTDSRAGIAEGGGTILARFPDPEQATGRLWGQAFEPVARALRDGGERAGFIESPDTGFMPNRLIGYRAIDLENLPTSRPLYAFVSRDSGEIYAPWWRDLARRVARLSVFAAFAAAGLWLLQRRRRAHEALEATLAAEREAADRAFRKNAERMRLAFDSAHLGLWHWDLRDERLEVSAHALAHLGLPAGTPMSYDKCLMAIHPEDRDRFSRAVAWTLETHTDFRADYRVVWPDGTVRWLNATGRPFFGADGTPERLETVTQDITERKAVETELIDSRAKLDERRRQVELLNVQLESRAVDAEAASRAKDAFLRNMSHELRTPLNHISGGAELLLMAGPTAEQRGWLQVIQTAARDLLRMVTEILEVARAQSGELALNRVPFSPSAVVEEASLVLSHRAEAKGLRLHVAVDAGVPQRLLGDPTRLAQGLLAYVDNAIKFTERGSITIGAFAEKADAQSATLRFEVRDTGIGIAPSAVADLFKPFTQGDETLTRAYGGAGIGLAAVSTIAARMGGTVGVRSEPGKGSTFWFTATFAIAADALAPDDAPAPAPPADRAVAGRALASIESRLADCDFRAYGLLVENAEALGAVLGDDHAKLKRQVELLDFGGALATVRGLRGRLEAAAPRAT